MFDLPALTDDDHEVVPPEPPPRRPLVRKPRRPELIGVMAAAALGASVAPPDPTGNELGDAFWCALLAVSVTFAASRSRRWPWLWLTGLAAAGSIGSWWAGLALVSLVLAIAAAFSASRDRLHGAVVGALAVQVLLRLPEQGFHGWSAVLVAVAVAPVIWSAYERSPRRVRRRVRRVALVGAGGLALVVFVFAVSMAVARDDLDRAVDDARAGLDRLGDGEQEEGADQLADAADGFATASDLIGAPWTFPAEFVPVLADHREALVVAAETGARVAEAGATASATAPYQELKAADGVVDIGVAGEMYEPVDAAAAALRAARADLAALDSEWLLPPVASALDDFSAEVRGALPEAELAAEALRVVPALFGAQGERTYLVLFTNPAEARFLGGFAGSFGLLTASGGQVDFSVSGRISELFDGPQPADLITPHEEYAERYERFSPNQFPQNLTVSPDLPSDAAVVRDLYEHATGQLLDGLVVVDPYAIAALLELTGPVDVEGLDEPLTPENAARYLVLQQYVGYGDDRDDRKDRLEAAGRATFDALTSRALPGPRTIGDALAPLVEQHRLLFYPYATDEQPLFDRIGASGRFAAEAGDDFFSVRVHNANPNKIDTYLQRNVEYQVDYDPATGALEARAVVQLRNAAPAVGLPPYVIGNERRPPQPPGTNTTYVSVYTPHDLVASTVNGEPVSVESQSELGLHVYSALLTIPAGQQVEIVLDLVGSLGDEGGDYRLAYAHQPLVQSEGVALQVRSTNRRYAPDIAASVEVDEADALDEPDWVELELVDRAAVFEAETRVDVALRVAFD